MDRLSSCYFCGIALDEPLRDYPLAPGDGDPAAVVTLCPTCRRKLETVLSTVTSPSAEESDDPAIVTETAAELNAAGADPEALEANTPDVDDEPIVMEAEETSEPDDGEMSAETVTEDDGGIETAADVTAAAESSTDDTEDAGTADEPGPAGQSGDGDPDDHEATSGEEADEEIQNVMEPDVPTDLQTGETTEEEPGSADSRGEERDTGTRADEANKRPSGDDGSAEEDDVETTVSALEYNKVMRLLQNREFPIERAEIVALAANAYELTEAECEEVVDLAVDRGLVDQEDGQLVRPDG